MCSLFKVVSSAHEKYGICIGPKCLRYPVHLQNQDHHIDPSALANATPEEQKQILGERLFAQIHVTHPDLAGKITGMLLEIENAELLHMLESSEALHAKVDEAVSVLRAHQAREVQSQVEKK